MKCLRMCSLNALTDFVDGLRCNSCMLLFFVVTLYYTCILARMSAAARNKMAHAHPAPYLHRRPAAMCVVTRARRNVT